MDLIRQSFEMKKHINMKRPLYRAIALLLVIPAFTQCARKPLLPDYEPLCTGMTPGTRPEQSPLSARHTQLYRVGPKGGIYHVNIHNKKVYIKSPRTQ